MEYHKFVCLKYKEQIIENGLLFDRFTLFESFIKSACLHQRMSCSKNVKALIKKYGLKNIRQDELIATIENAKVEVNRKDIHGIYKDTKYDAIREKKAKENESAVPEIPQIPEKFTGKRLITFGLRKKKGKK